MNLLLKKVNLFFITIIFALANVIPAGAERLSLMVENVLDSHEDIINSKKEEFYI